MGIWYEGNLNQVENRRELEGHIYYIRGTIIVEGQCYERYGIQTHFIEEGEDYLSLIDSYVMPLYKKGDLLAISEKVIAMCQKQTARKEMIKLGFWAKFLSRFATRNKNGVGMSEPYKLQLAIQLKGLPLVLWASFCSGIGKLFGKRGIFYQILGKEVAGIDGFYEHSAFERYHHLAVLSPKAPNDVCETIYKHFQCSTLIADANDIAVELLGVSSDLKGKEIELKALIQDNPAGQDDECTPFILIRPINEIEAETYVPKTPVIYPAHLL